MLEKGSFFYFCNTHYPWNLFKALAWSKLSSCKDGHISFKWLTKDQTPHILDYLIVIMTIYWTWEVRLASCYSIIDVTPTLFMFLGANFNLSLSYYKLVVILKTKVFSFIGVLFTKSFPIVASIMLFSICKSPS